MSTAPRRAGFLIFSCGACGKKIFADRAQAGRTGQCPLCGGQTVIAPPAGKVAPTASGSRAPSSDKRRGRRVALKEARLAFETKANHGQPLSPDDLAALEDISETGVGFAARGEHDRKRLSGWGPPPNVRVGDVITVTLHVPELFRPRTLKAVVRRIVPHKASKELFRVGAEFQGLSEEARNDLRKLVEMHAS